MKKLLLIIDYQNDFVANHGTLTAGAKAQAIEQALVRRISRYRKEEQDVFCTLDTHTSEHWHEQPEGKLFSLHCAKGSEGWQLYGRLADLDLETLTKSSYMLEQTDIDWLVQQYDAIELAGVATEICVLQNAIGLYNHAVNQNLDIKFSVLKSCVAGLNEEDEAFALEYLKTRLGFSVR